MRRGHARMRPAKALVWGFFLIALGSAFLLQQLQVIKLSNLGELWPVVFAVIAVSHIADGRLGSALTFLLLCAWFFACEFGWYGLDYHNSWPLVLVAVGVGIVARALGGDLPRRVREGGES